MDNQRLKLFTVCYESIILVLKFSNLFRKLIFYDDVYCNSSCDSVIHEMMNDDYDDGDEDNGGLHSSTDRAFDLKTAPASVSSSPKTELSCNRLDGFVGSDLFFLPETEEKLEKFKALLNQSNLQLPPCCNWKCTITLTT